MCQVCSTYQHLEQRPHKWRKQLCIKGRNMTVWHLVGAMRTNRETPEQTAKNRGLSLETVLEAMHYYILHRNIVEEDTEEEKRRLIAKGYKLD